MHWKRPPPLIQQQRVVAPRTLEWSAAFIPQEKQGHVLLLKFQRQYHLLLDDTHTHTHILASQGPLDWVVHVVPIVRRNTKLRHLKVTSGLHSMAGDLFPTGSSLTGMLTCHRSLENIGVTASGHLEVEHLPKQTVNSQSLGKQLQMGRCNF